MAVLVLLQGFNPLPNYVVADYLLNNGDTILGDAIDTVILFYSEKTDANVTSTKPHAENVKNALERRGQVYQFPLTNINKGSVIQKEIESHLKDMITAHANVHLNYTGGTKAMGVHAYLTLEHIASSVHCGFDASYLDDRTFKLYWEGVDLPPTQVRRAVNIDIETLLRLHSYEITAPVARQLNDTERTLAVMAEQLWINDRDEYRRVVSILRRIFKVDGKPISRTTQLKRNVDSLQSQQPDFWTVLKDQPGLVDCFPALNHLSRNPEDEGPAFSNNLVKADVELFKKFDGLWLEHYLKSQVADIAETMNVTVTPKNFGQSLEAKRVKGRKKFELDLFMILGYEFVGISVTTHDREPLCKEKGFEVIHRTRQIGGDGRVAFLVTLLPEEGRSRVEEELKNDCDISDRFHVFGEDDIQHLGSRVWEELRRINGE